jgi:hypothetical protein
MAYAEKYVQLDGVDRANVLAKLLVFAFVLVCVFDPADQILGIKTLTFAAIWGAALASVALANDRVAVSIGLIEYVLVFIGIPLLSILWYYAQNGQQPFEGFPLFKGYFLVTLAIALAFCRVDLVPQLCAALTFLSLLIIGVFAVLTYNPDLYQTLKPLGDSSGLLILDKRSYSDDFDFLQVYFVTSPMLAIPIAYYFDRAMSANSIAGKAAFLLIALTNIVGMFLAGTRNNMLVSLLLPFLLWPPYTKRVALFMFCSLAALAVLSLPFSGYLLAFFDPTESGNSIKLATFEDYYRIFSDPIALLFGHGLGSYETWSARPSSYITELTYLELFRNFGLVGGLVMLGLLLLPVANALLPRASTQQRSLAIAYFLYLLMCFSNPNLFSSMGILILAALLYRIFECEPATDMNQRGAIRD